MIGTTNIKNLPLSALNVSSAAPDYSLGSFFVDNSTGLTYPTTYLYVKAHAALTAFLPYTISTNNQKYDTIAAAATGTGVTICVPQIAVASGEYAWVPVKGIVTITSHGTVTAANALELINTGTMAIDAGGTTVDATFLGLVKTTGTGSTNQVGVKFNGINREVKSS